MIQWLRIHLAMTDMGSISGQGTKIPYASEQLNPPAATTEPAHSGACVPQLESPCTAVKDLSCHNEDPACQINKYSLKKKNNVKIKIFQALIYTASIIFYRTNKYIVLFDEI